MDNKMKYPLLKLALYVFAVAFVIALIMVFIDLCILIANAEAGENRDDIAFDIAAFAGEWVPTLRYMQIKDTADSVVDTVVSIGDSSVTRDTIYTFLYEAGGVTTGVAVDSFLVQVLDSNNNPIDTIWVLEDYADVWDTNYFNAPYWVNIRDSLNNVLYGYYASKDSSDAFAVNHWQLHYSIGILDSNEVLVYVISATQDSPNTYIRNWLGQAPAGAKGGVPGTNDYCEITGVVQGPEGTRITNAPVKFRLRSHFPVFWGDVLITQTLWSTTTDDTGGIKLSLLRNKDLSDTLSYYEVNVIKADLRNAKAVIPKGYNSMPWQGIFTTH